MPMRGSTRRNGSSSGFGDPSATPDSPRPPSPAGSGTTTAPCERRPRTAAGQSSVARAAREPSCRAARRISSRCRARSRLGLGRHRDVGRREEVHAVGDLVHRPVRARSRARWRSRSTRREVSRSTSCEVHDDRHALLEVVGDLLGLVELAWAARCTARRRRGTTRTAEPWRTGRGARRSRRAARTVTRRHRLHAAARRRALRLDGRRLTGWFLVARALLTAARARATGHGRLLVAAAARRGGRCRSSSAGSSRTRRTRRRGRDRGSSSPS